MISQKVRQLRNLQKHSWVWNCGRHFVFYLHLILGYFEPVFPQFSNFFKLKSLEITRKSHARDKYVSFHNWNVKWASCTWLSSEILNHNIASWAKPIWDLHGIPPRKKEYFCLWGFYCGGGLNPQDAMGYEFLSQTAKYMFKSYIKSLI